MCEGLDPDRCEARRQRLQDALGSPEMRQAILHILQRPRWQRSWMNDLQHQADEILSTVAVRALENVCKYDPDQGAIPWLASFALNVLREQDRFLRRDRAHLVPQHAMSEDAWQEVLNRLVAQPRDPEEEERLEAVNRALARLPPEQSRVLELRFRKELSWLEVGRILGLAEGTARVRGHRALLALRDRLLPGQEREET